MLSPHDNAAVARRLMKFAADISRAVIVAACALLPAASPDPASAAPCAFDAQGEGRVADIVDGRSFHLNDGREIKLAGIEPVSAGRATLATIIADRDVTLRGVDDAPDRYGRQQAFAFLGSAETSVQALLLQQGAALFSADVADRDCAAALLAAETEAREARKGIWATGSVIKNAESPDDILTGIGRFTVVEGRVLSVRTAGATTYLNFGRSWTRGFAVTISRRMMPAVANAGVAVKSLENKRIRVRGFVEARPGPRIEVARSGQIEVVGGN